MTLSGWSAGKTEDDLLQSVVDDFNSTHPNIHVDYSVINGDYATAMTARFAAHNPPDVFYVDSSIAPTWIKQGVVQPLNAYIKKSKYDTSKFYPGSPQRVQGREDVLRLPEGLVAARRGDQQVDVRQGGDQKAPRTWAELTADAQKLASSNAVPNGKPLCLPADWARMLAFVFQNNGSLANVQSPAVAAAVNYYIGFFKRGLAATPDRARGRLARRGARKGEGGDHLRGQLGAPVHEVDLPEVGFGVGPMVKGKVNGNLGFTVSYSMAKDAENKQAAWTLLSYLTGKVGDDQMDVPWSRAAVAHGREGGRRSGSRSSPPGRPPRAGASRTSRPRSRS